MFCLILTSVLEIYYQSNYLSKPYLSFTHVSKGKTVKSMAENQIKNLPLLQEFKLHHDESFSLVLCLLFSLFTSSLFDGSGVYF